MKLEHAERIAAALVERLAPFCSELRTQNSELRTETSNLEPQTQNLAIAVAGSIRRRRPEVNDIDLVAIPQLETVRRGLFEEAAESPEKSRLAVAVCAAAEKIHQRGPKNISVQMAFPEELAGEIPAAQFAAGVRVDLYLATPETWATTLLIRTGSKEHNIWLCQRARELGGKLHADGSGLELSPGYDGLMQRMKPAGPVASATEDEILQALCFGSAPVPEAREVNPRTHRPLWCGPHRAEATGGAR